MKWDMNALGTLTIGVKNEGTKGSEWTGIGNFGLVYLGEEDGLDGAITNALQDAANYNAARINTLTAYNPDEELFGQGDVYVPIDIYNETEFTYSDRPNFPAAMKEALKENSDVPTYEAEVAIGETMKAIYDAKKGYAALYEAQQKVGDHWSDYVTGNELDDDIFEVGDALNAGTYADADAALEAKAALYEKWPDYLRIKEPYKVDILSDENLSFDLLATDPNGMTCMNLWKRTKSFLPSNIQQNKILRMVSSIMQLLACRPMLRTQFPLWLQQLIGLLFTTTSPMVLRNTTSALLLTILFTGTSTINRFQQAKSSLCRLATSASSQWLR